MKTNYRGLSIPYTPMGRAVSSDNLFDPNEQVIFDFYEANPERYRRVVDVGANIGVHSILMARLGWEVRAFEPDPEHHHNLRMNVEAHGVAGLVRAEQAAVSDQDGHVEFCRVLDNLTSSHLRGDKTPYGPVQYIMVPAVDCRPLFAWADFVKLDCEGHEARIIAAVPSRAWVCTDALLEVGSAENARAVYERLSFFDVPMWSQKMGWRRVRSMFDVPAHHSEGSLFVGRFPPFQGGPP